MNRKSSILAGLALLPIAVGLSGCDQPPPTPVDRLAQQAQQAAQRSAAATTHSQEVANIERRRTLFGRAGVVGYVVFLNAGGQPVYYTTTDGKCSSSGKRLTSAYRPTFTRSSVNGVTQDHVAWERISEDGTQGSSDDYIYCFGTDGRYMQWSGPYFWSDRPIELTVRPLVVEVAQPGQGRTIGQ